MGFFIKLKYPTVDTLAKCMFTLGQDCWFYKIDMEGAFRQLQMDPADFRLIGYFWNGNFYFDLVFPMGLCQGVTNAFRYIHEQLGYFLLNYIDDFQGAEKRQFVWQAYHTLERLFRDLEIKISPEKTVEPTQTVEFLGTWFNAIKGTMEVTPDRLRELAEELKFWATKISATMKV